MINNTYVKKKYEMINKLKKVVNENNLTSLTVRESCNILNISIGNYYHYFPNKGDIVLIWLSDLDQLMLDEIKPKFNDDQLHNLKLFMKGLVEINLRRDINKNKFIDKLLYESIPSINTSPKFERYTITILNEIISRALETKQIKSTYTIEEYINLVATTTRGIIENWVKNNQNYDLMDRMDKYADIFIEGIKQ